MTSSAILTPCGVSRRASEPSALSDFSGTGGSYQVWRLRDRNSSPADSETQNDGADLGERSRRHHESVYTFIVTTASMAKLAIDQGKILREFLGRGDIGTDGNYGGLA
jgi:hypothetical protein